MFHPLATSHTAHTFPLGTRLQYVSYPQVSVVKSIVTSLFTPQARTVSVSAASAAGLFHPSTAVDASAELLIRLPQVAPTSTCKSYVIIQLVPESTSIEEKERVGSKNDSPGVPQFTYVKLYGVPKSVSITSVREIPVASLPVLPIVTVYFIT